MKKIIAASAFFLVTTAAAAHPGHGGKGWFHQHQDDVVDAAMIAVACLAAVMIVRVFWKVVSRP